jgi:hypothetical protein
MSGYTWKYFHSPDERINNEKDQTQKSSDIRRYFDGCTGRSSLRAPLFVVAGLVPAGVQEMPVSDVPY